MFQFEEILSVELEHRPVIQPEIRPERKFDGATHDSHPSLHELIADLATEVRSLSKDNAELKDIVLSMNEELTLVKLELQLLRKGRADVQGGAVAADDDDEEGGHDAGGNAGDKKDVEEENVEKDKSAAVEKDLAADVEKVDVEKNVDEAAASVEKESVENTGEKNAVLDVGGLEKLAAAVEQETVSQSVDAAGPVTMRHRLPGRFEKCPYGVPASPKRRGRKRKVMKTIPHSIVDPARVSAHFVPLTDEENELVDRTLTDGDKDNPPEIKDKTIRDDLLADVKLSPFMIWDSLTPGACVAEEIIDMYCALLKRREMDPKNAGLYYTCHFMSPHFYQCLTRGGYDFVGVRPWCSGILIPSLQSNAEKVFIPIHDPNASHWTLAVIDSVDKKLQYFDSMGEFDRKVLETVAKFYMEDAVRFGGHPDFDMGDWAYEQAEHIPLQGNGHDCGVFMLKYIDFLCSRSKPGFPFDQSNMDYFRRRIARDCIQGKVEA